MSSFPNKYDTTSPNRSYGRLCWLWGESSLEFWIGVQTIAEVSSDCATLARNNNSRPTDSIAIPPWGHQQMEFGKLANYFRTFTQNMVYNRLESSITNIEAQIGNCL